MQSQELLNQGLLLSCLSRAREAEHLGDYDLAVRLLGRYWRGVGQRPTLDILPDGLAAEILLRVGALTGYLGSAARVSGAQEMALDLLNESLTIFSKRHLRDRIAEVRIELATCYRRQGFYDAARAMLDGAEELLAEGDPYLRGLAVVRRIITEVCASELDEAFKFLTAAETVVNASGNPALRGRFYNEFGVVYFELSDRDGVPRWAEALRKFHLSLQCFEQAGHLRYCALVENNLGLALIKLGHLTEAAPHVMRAYRLAQCLDDQSQITEIEDTYSQLLIEQGRLTEAEAVGRKQLDNLAGTDHHAQLAETLVTHAVALARLGRVAEAREEFEHAGATARFMGDFREAERIDSLGEAELNVPNVLRFPGSMGRGLLTFEWRIADESLMDIGIREGDAVRFKVSERFKDGDLVAVITPDGRFAMFIYSEHPGRIRLEGAHPRCKPRRYRCDELTVLGVAEPP